MGLLETTRSSFDIKAPTAASEGRMIGSFSRSIATGGEYAARKANSDTPGESLPIFLDGVYADPDNTGTPEFFPLPAPDDHEIARVSAATTRGILHLRPQRLLSEVAVSLAGLVEEIVYINVPVAKQLEEEGTLVLLYLLADKSHPSTITGVIDVYEQHTGNINEQYGILIVVGNTENFDIR